jgi:hypothetical protein
MAFLSGLGQSNEKNRPVTGMSQTASEENDDDAWVGAEWRAEIEIIKHTRRPLFFSSAPLGFLSTHGSAHGRSSRFVSFGSACFGQHIHLPAWSRSCTS